jgi:serine/threonine protein kinase
VYTAVNNQTGELMAMKEIQLQPNDHRTIRRVAEELRIFEGIQHSNLVHYYGVEIHRVSQNIFSHVFQTAWLCLILSANYGSSHMEKHLTDGTAQNMCCNMTGL